MGVTKFSDLNHEEFIYTHLNHEEFIYTHLTLVTPHFKPNIQKASK